MLLSLLLLILALLIFRFRLRLRLLRNRPPVVIGAFVIPGFPYVGNTFQVLSNPSKTFMEWREKYGHSIFVIHLGSVPVVVVNDRKDIECVWKHHSTALISRPTSHTFHKIISASQGPTIGTTPAGESFRRKRKVLSRALSPTALASQTHVEAIDQCSRYIIKNILDEIHTLDPLRAPFSDVSLLRHFQCYVLRCAVQLTYGISLDTHGRHQQLADKIIETENHIINFRSFISNFQDYLRIFRVFPFSKLVRNDAQFWKHRRDQYVGQLQTSFEKRLQNNDHSSSHSLLAQSISETANSRVLSHQEARSICLTMISAGLDNLGFTMNYIMGQLSNPQYGYSIQERLYSELMAQNESSPIKAWQSCAHSISCSFALAIIHEALRQFSVLPLGLPRTTTKPIRFQGIVIPENIVLIMNAYAANHDPDVYPEHDSFRPQRWLDETGKIYTHMHKEHLTFGIGSRRCVGDSLSIREMYVLLCRLVLVFHIRSPRDKKWTMQSDPFLSNSNPAATSFEPKQFRVWLRPRQGKPSDLLEQLLAECQ